MVDVALAEVRKAINIVATNTLEWGIPVLYSSSTDGFLFDLGQRRGWGFEGFSPKRWVILIVTFLLSIVFLILSLRNIFNPPLAIFLTVAGITISIVQWLFPLQPPTQQMPAWLKHLWPKFRRSRRKILIGLGATGVAGLAFTLLLPLLNKSSTSSGPGNNSPDTGISSLGTVLNPNTSSMNAVGWSPDGKYIATASDDT